MLALLTLAIVVLPSVASAAGEEVHFEQTSGDCQHPWVLVGSGFPANAAIDVTVPVPQMGTQEPVAEVTTDAEGAFRVELPESFPGDECMAGSILGVQAATADGAASAVAAYEVDSPYSLVIEACDASSMTVVGADFPPGERLTLLLGEDIPFEVNYEQLDALETDANGAFTSTVAGGCPAPGSVVIAASEAGWARAEPPNMKVPAAEAGYGVPISHSIAGPVILGGLLLGVLLAARTLSLAPTDRERDR